MNGCGLCSIRYKYVVFASTFVEDISAILSTKQLGKEILYNHLKEFKKDYQRFEKNWVYDSDGKYLTIYKSVDKNILNQFYKHIKYELYLFPVELPEFFLKDNIIDYSDVV